MSQNIYQFLGNFVGNQITKLTTIANYASLVAHMPQEYEAKIFPVPGGFPVVGSKPNFSPMVFSIDIYDTDPNPQGPRAATSALALPGNASSGLGIRNASSAVAAAFRPKKRFYVPPLTLFVNPSDVNFSATKVVNPTYAKGGWVVEHWGEELDRLNVEGRTGGFYTGNVLFENKAGLTRINARNSAAYQNLMALYLIYKNNGYNFEKQFDKRRINSVGKVKLYYDFVTYTGTFKSFRILEDAEMPFSFSYSFEFIVTKWQRGMQTAALMSQLGTLFGMVP